MGRKPLAAVPSVPPAPPAISTDMKVLALFALIAVAAATEEKPAEEKPATKFVFGSIPYTAGAFGFAGLHHPGFYTVKPDEDTKLTYVAGAYPFAGYPYTYTAGSPITYTAGAPITYTAGAPITYSAINPAIIPKYYSETEGTRHIVN